MPLEIFYSYAHEDEKLRDQLDKHLRLLQRLNLIVGWHDRRIDAGDEWRNRIDEHINSAHIILLLISPDFIVSEYCYAQEMNIALARHGMREAIVIPIILRPVNWTGAPFGELQALPRDATPITTWTDQDEAFAAIAGEIRELVLSFQARVPGLARDSDVPVNQSASQKRMLDAAIPGHIVKGEPTELMVLIRLPDSPGLQGILKTDEDSEIRPEDVESKAFGITFPRGFDGFLQPLKVAVELTSPDFLPPCQSKNLFVPPDTDSNPYEFILTPTRVGSLKVLVELHWEDAIRGQRRLITECAAVAEPQTAHSPKNVVQMPIVVETFAATSRGDILAAEEPTAPPGLLEDTSAHAAHRFRGTIKIFIAGITVVSLAFGSYRLFVYNPAKDRETARSFASQVSPRAPVPIVFFDYVLNAKTKQPVPDGFVAMNFESSAGLLEDYTDTDGSFHFLLRGVKLDTNARISVRVKNFQPFEKDIVQANSTAINVHTQGGTMNAVLYGATGMIGSRILNELISRGHQVTAVVRDPSQVPAHPGVSAVKGDIFDPLDVTAKVCGTDAVISAYGPGQGPVENLLLATRSLIAGLTQADVKRLIFIGGAGSLHVAPGVDLIDSGHLPEEYKAIAIAHRDALNMLRESDLAWTYFSPAAFIQPGERTGNFRLGADSLVADAQGNSRISAEDYAVALVDELEHPKRIRQQMTAAY